MLLQSLTWHSAAQWKRAEHRSFTGDDEFYPHLWDDGDAVINHSIKLYWNGKVLDNSKWNKKFFTSDWKKMWYQENQNWFRDDCTPVTIKWTVKNNLKSNKNDDKDQIKYCT